MNDGAQHGVAPAKIDWRDVQAGLGIGFVYAMLLVLKWNLPKWDVGESATNVPFILTIAYIIWRGQNEPGKFDAWGLTAPITGWAALIMLGFITLTAALLAAAALMLGGELHFEPRFIFRMADYIRGAFPQQFFLCSVGLTSLETFPVLRGSWRLPLVVGICFGAAHFWTPAHFPGSAIPLQVMATAPMGFFAAWYFLRFRSILPLILFHIVAFVLYVQWLEGLL